MGERRECSEGELAVGIGLSWGKWLERREAWVDVEDKAAWTDIMGKGIAGSLCDRGARAGRVR
jgi:hypothetical protein